MKALTKLESLYHALLQILFTIATITTVSTTYERVVGEVAFRNTTGVIVSMGFFVPAIVFVLWMVFGDSKVYERFMENPSAPFYAVLNTSHIITMFIRLFWVIEHAVIYGIHTVTTRQFLEIFIPDLGMAIRFTLLVAPVAIIISLFYYMAIKLQRSEDRRRGH